MVTFVQDISFYQKSRQRTENLKMFLSVNATMYLPAHWKIVQISN